MDPITINHLIKSPHMDIVNGYLYLHPRVAKLLKLIDNFTTFAEMIDDLQLIDRKYWFATLTIFPQKELDCYEVRGHGFLKRMDQ